MAQSVVSTSISLQRQSRIIRSYAMLVSEHTFFSKRHTTKKITRLCIQQDQRAITLTTLRLWTVQCKAVLMMLASAFCSDWRHIVTTSSDCLCTPNTSKLLTVLVLILLAFQDYVWQTISTLQISRMQFQTIFSTESSLS